MILDENITNLRKTLAWYFTHYYGIVEGPDSIPFFCSPEQVGSFAVSQAGFSSGTPDALFKVAICLSMYQASRDTVIMGKQRSFTEEEVCLLTDAEKLLSSLVGVGCHPSKNLSTVVLTCDVFKDKLGNIDCHSKPGAACPLKQASQLLGRYGDYGKLPVSLSIIAMQDGGGTLAGLYKAALDKISSPLERSKWLEKRLCAAWRINKKLANLILSTFSNPDLFPGSNPWKEGLDWNYFVVLDRHALAGLDELGSPSGSSYERTRDYLQAISRSVDLREFSTKCHGYNPRIVQQAIYRFRSKSNRLANKTDCCNTTPSICTKCDQALSAVCPVRRGL